MIIWNVIGFRNYLNYVFTACFTGIFVFPAAFFVGRKSNFFPPSPTLKYSKFSGMNWVKKTLSKSTSENQNNVRTGWINVTTHITRITVYFNYKFSRTNGWVLHWILNSILKDSIWNQQKTRKKKIPSPKSDLNLTR